ncbi:hypothetical protein BC832DRAFT_595801 [Gaertneriomyces semiglobifer]|nr:hypothetical protein BC832DRAFT_595801 [Gaertneriomyces semiglobifer]
MWAVELMKSAPFIGLWKRNVDPASTLLQAWMTVPHSGRRYTTCGRRQMATEPSCAKDNKWSVTSKPVRRPMDEFSLLSELDSHSQQPDDSKEPVNYGTTNTSFVYLGVNETPADIAPVDNSQTVGQMHFHRSPANETREHVHGVARLPDRVSPPSTRTPARILQRPSIDVNPFFSDARVSMIEHMVEEAEQDPYPTY